VFKTQSDRWFHPLLSPDDGSGGGGGDGSGGEGDDGNNQPPAMTADEMKRLMGNMVNSAVNSHFKRDSFQQLISSSVEKAVTGLLPKPEDPKPAPEDPKPDARDAELAKMRSEQDKMRKALEAQREEAETEKRKAREQAERSALAEALRSGGVDENRMRAAVAYLYLDERRIRRDEDDNIVMSFQREWGEELVPVDKGIAEYLRSDQGKVFLPPVEAAGSGNKGGRPPNSKGNKLSRSEKLEQLGQLMMRPPS
jgi:hypothetical protein